MRLLLNFVCTLSQVLELVKNIEDLRLDLPSGRGQGSQALWKLPPYSTKTIMNAHFKASTINNFTGYIRLVSFVGILPSIPNLSYL